MNKNDKKSQFPEYSRRSLSFMQQVNILLRDLCDLHKVPLPSELDTLLSPSIGEPSGVVVQQPSETKTVKDSDADNDQEFDAVSLESETYSEDEDLSMEIEALKNKKKVCHFKAYYNCCAFSQEKRTNRVNLASLQNDEIASEHSATLERLEKKQHQKYMTVS